MELDETFMQEAFRLAMKARAADEVPVGAVVVREGRIISRAYNQVELLKDATAHAEMLALTAAEAAVGDWRLNDCDIYVTKEPCPMCAGAIVQARVPMVVYGTVDPKAGACHTLYQITGDPRLNHRAQVIGGVLAERCGAVLSAFFEKKRKEGKK